MKKFLLILSLFFFLISYLNADYLNTRNRNICIYNLQPFQGSRGICYTNRLDNVNYCRIRTTFDDLIAGYEFVNGGCYLKNDLQITGLTQNQWDYLLAVLANVLGFTMLFLISYLSVLIAKK